jgi:phosphorylcholine metabolism protein LicD
MKLMQHKLHSVIKKTIEIIVKNIQNEINSMFRQVQSRCYSIKSLELISFELLQTDFYSRQFLTRKWLQTIY